MGKKKGKAVGGSTYVTGPTCTHDGVRQVGQFKKSGTRIWGANFASALHNSWVLRVDLTGGFSKDTPIVSANKACLDLLPASLTAAKPSPVLLIDWPDGGIVRLGAEYWRELAKVIRVIPGDIVFHCHGGHGRTGTALAILGCHWGWFDGGDPVEMLREVYCAKACETDAQLDYIEAMTGFKVLVKASRVYKPAPVVAPGFYGAGHGVAGERAYGHGWQGAGASGERFSDDTVLAVDQAFGKALADD